MKTLFISDLDGTLLNREAELSRFTVDTLNDLIRAGTDFSVATARTLATVSHILKPLQLRLPIILMNGALIYDTQAKVYLFKKYIPLDTASYIIQVLKEYNLSGFMYEVKEDLLTTYYERLTSKAMQDFYEERVRKYQKPFTRVPDLSEANRDRIVYFSILDTKEHIEGAYEKLKAFPEIALAFYKDVYTEGDYWFLEIFNPAVSKYNAVQYLKETFHYEKIIGFGDNLNDIPLFKACDVTCAVKNAREELKELADHVLDSNENDGVAKYVRRYVLESQN